MTTKYKKGQKFTKDGKTMQIISVNADGTATYAEVDKRTGKLKQGFQGNLPALNGSSKTPTVDTITRLVEYQERREETSIGFTGRPFSLSEYNEQSSQVYDEEYEWYKTELGLDEMSQAEATKALEWGKRNRLYEKAQAYDEYMNETYHTPDYDGSFPSDSEGRPLILRINPEWVRAAANRNDITREQENKFYEFQSEASTIWMRKKQR